MSRNINAHPIIGSALIATTLLAGSGVLSGCGPTKAEAAANDVYWTNQAKEDALPEYVKKCRESNVRHYLPTATNVTSIEDKRTGPVFACQYLRDAGIPINKPVNLLKSDEKTFASQDFSLSGNVGGVAVLGTGFLDGKIEANGTTNMKSIVGIQFMDADGAIVKAKLDGDGDKIHYKPCKTEAVCNKVTFNVSNTELWQKDEKDHTSIWEAHYEYHGGYADDDARRLRTVTQVSVAAPSDNTEAGDWKGGPASLGQIVSALVDNVTVEVPQSAIDAMSR